MLTTIARAQLQLKAHSIHCMDHGLDDPTLMSSEEMLEQAIVNEQLARDCGPSDPAYEHFIRVTRSWLTLAQAKELVELANKPVPGAIFNIPLNPNHVMMD